jgi:hypothetical protein
MAGPPPPMDPVPAWRVFTGSDGRAHAERFEFELNPGAMFKELAISEWVPASSAFFVRNSREMALDWHPAPRRQMVILVRGEAECELSDGTSFRYGPGTVLFLEDLEGIGHITRGAGDEDPLYVFIPVSDDWHPPTSPKGAIP